VNTPASCGGWFAGNALRTVDHYGGCTADSHTTLVAVKPVEAALRCCYLRTLNRLRRTVGWKAARTSAATFSFTAHAHARHLCRWLRPLDRLPVHCVQPAFHTYNSMRHTGRRSWYGDCVAFCVFVGHGYTLSATTTGADYTASPPTSLRIRCF